MAALALVWHLVSLIGSLTVMTICALALLGIVEVEIHWTRRRSRE